MINDVQVQKRYNLTLQSKPNNTEKSQYLQLLRIQPRNRVFKKVYPQEKIFKIRQCYQSEESFKLKRLGVNQMKKYKQIDKEL
ncbi:unnamed protein product [Paramecium sonneborni]|uniref:Uncharacterized protein n=1 Tax=Paramecium sonneborni TaxID=65129 RepID=A0A8S1JWZ0_9CILI|nr:unnamed protein product [Paramecium sonneborni]